jgi:hypothetical protein
VVGDLAYFIGGTDSKQIKVLDMRQKTRLANIAIPNLATHNIMGNFILFEKSGKLYFDGDWDGIMAEAVKDFYVSDPSAKVLTKLADLPEVLPSYAPPYGVKDGILHLVTGSGLFAFKP